ncbi:hypothetical protein QTQ03_23450 [Micromonospora sp. WMMA1363]|uniref:hypothetical protein n=1 Tax=Micromonospora sp. WMMA1363 TaxID=3053985 RepID=UPI00259CBB46|nr:hypothetical protein [Micromonospora sp. WMMA1363]MDM4722398.1 hypothetical protein [Micromonospora sp. WMMA1363]
MNTVSGRRADEHPAGPPAGGRQESGAPPRGGAVAPHPRPVPAAPPAADPAVEIEPTTGAPVDSLPRRVPVRQPRRLRRGRSRPSDPPDGEEVWAPIEEVHWDGTPVKRESDPGRGRVARFRRWRRQVRRPAHPPDPLPSLVALVALSLVAAFFAWVSAAPLWLAVGHGTTGQVVIDDCTGGGLTQRCRGNFVASTDRWVAHGVVVTGVPRELTTSGSLVPARMTGPDAGTAYAGTGAGGHLRWLLGLLAVAGCGAGIAHWTGATRLADRRARRWAIAASAAGPLLITVGFLVTAW